MSEQYIGKYRIEDRLGSGTFATVYRCYDPDLDSICAVKVLAENWSEDENARNWFLNEARVMFGIEHPAILRVFTSGSLEDGRPYIVMEYADQGSLADLIRERRSANRRFETAEALEISIAIAEGLNVAHGRGLVHRDLKPSNILFRRPPESAGEPSNRPLIKLADFGLARRLEQGANSLAGAGTPHYIAPEQARGLADERPDVRNDIYSAATILYEMLAGQVPFPYKSITQVVAAHLEENPPAIQELAPDVPNEVAELIHAGLAKRPDERVPTALAWQQHLQVLRTALNPDGSISGFGESGTRKAPTDLSTQAIARSIENAERRSLPPSLIDERVDPRDGGAEQHVPRESESGPEKRSNPMARYAIAAAAIGLIVVSILGFALADLAIDDQDGNPGGGDIVAEIGDSENIGVEAPASPTPDAITDDEPSPTPEETESVETPEPEPTATPESQDAPQLEPVLSEIAETLRALPSVASSAIILPSGEAVDEDGNRQVAAASTIKLWVAATAYEEIAMGNLDFDDEHIVRSEEQAFGTGILNQEQYAGQTFTIGELIETMVLHSDNTAANIIIDRVGGMERVNEYASEQGYEDTLMQRLLGDLDPDRENYTSALDGATFMQRLINDEIVDPESSDHLRSVLEQRSANDAVELDFFGRYLPDELTYSHISGLLPGVRNEVGYFYHEDLDGYVLVSFMLGDQSNEAQAEDVIAETVAEIHRHLVDNPDA